MNTMGNFDHISLGLTLGVGSPKNINIDYETNNQVATTKIEPDDEYIYNLHQRASNSTSFSNSCNSIKRERDHDFINNEQVHHEPPHDDVDENGNSNRKKLRLTKEQSAILEDTFKDHSTLNTVLIFKLLIHECLYISSS
jgi:hypothetical protein